MIMFRLDHDSDKVLKRNLQSGLKLDANGIPFNPGENFEVFFIFLKFPSAS